MKHDPGITRRGLAGILAAAPARAAAQAPPAPVGELEAARERLRSAAQELRAKRVSAATEPAFKFQA